MCPSTETSSPFGERALAAIMFTDVQNFSGLVGEKEDRTLKAVKRDFKLMTAIVEQSAGRIVKSTGDGLLVYFPSALNAVACGAQMQAGIAAQTGPAELLRLEHRIGIHLGEVFFADNDVLGNGVNIAARLQKFSEPGGLAVSQTVYDVVRGKIKLSFKYLGPQTLRHIRDAIPVYGVSPSPPGATANPLIVAEAPRSRSKSPMRGSSAPFLQGSVSLRAAPAPRSATTATAKPRPSTVEHVALLGDFSGRGSRGLLEPLHPDRLSTVDIDSLERAFTRLNPIVRLPALGRIDEFIDVTFPSLEAFHPDHLLRTVAPLQTLWRLRAALCNPRTAPAAQRELAALLPPPPPAELRPASAAPGVVAGSAQSIVQRLLAASASTSASAAPTVADVDRELTAQLRALLQHPSFKRLEALWLGTQRLVAQFGDRDDVQLHLIDVSDDELRALHREGDHEFTDLQRLLAGKSWRFLLADFQAGPDADDIGVLRALAGTARALPAWLFAAGPPALARCASFAHVPDAAGWNLPLPAGAAEAWREFRAQPEAAHLALAAPRVLLRAPYAAAGESAAFPFEEIPEDFPHEYFLWGNPAFALAHATLAAAARGEREPQHIAGKLPDLPLHWHRIGSEKVVTPCVEAELSERTLRELAERGLCGLQVVRGRNVARVSGLSAAAAPRQTLAALAKR